MPPAVTHGRVGGLERSEDLVQERREAGERPTAGVVEKTRDGAEKVAEQVAWALLRRDVENHAIEMNHQTEQVQIQRAKRQMEDLAGAAGRDRKRNRLIDLLHSSGHGVGKRARERSDGNELPVLNGEARQIKGADEVDHLAGRVRRRSRDWHGHGRLRWGGGNGGRHEQQCGDERNKRDQRESAAVSVHLVPPSRLTRHAFPPPAPANEDGVNVLKNMTIRPL